MELLSKLEMKNFYLSCEYVFTRYQEQDIPDKLVTKLFGKVYFNLLGEGESIEGQAIGSYTLIRLNIEEAEACDLDISDFNFQEDLDENLLWEVYDDRSLGFRDSLGGHFDHRFSGKNVYFLERFFLAPEFRGYQLTKVIIKEMLEVFGRDASLIVVQPYPLQFDTSYPGTPAQYNKFMCDFEKASVKVSDLFESVGFEVVEGYEGTQFLNPKFYGH